MSSTEHSWFDQLLYTQSNLEGLSPFLVWLHLGADLLLFFAYLFIPLLLLHILRKHSRLRFDTTLACFAVFGIASALIHLMSALNIWQVHYQIAGLIKLIAALTSIPAAVLLARLVLRILSLPGHKEVSEANEALTRANREMEAFTASVSHDLRAPLGTIAGQAGMLEMSLGARATTDDRKRLQRIQGGIKQMAELIDALLALSRLSRYTLHKELIDASSLAQSIVTDLQQRDAARHVVVNIAAGMLVHGDRRLLTTMFSNLLGNAWKFTARVSDAYIEVGQVKEGPIGTLYVRDNGAGFDMAYSHKLFQPFQRLHTQSDFSGTGIGLATVARIVERHGGRIWAEAKPGGGATFYFTMRMNPLVLDTPKSNFAATPTSRDHAQHAL